LYKRAICIFYYRVSFNATLLFSECENPVKVNGKIPKCKFAAANGQYFEYQTCDNRCDTKAEPNVKAIFFTKGSRIIGDEVCVLPFNPCTPEIRCCAYPAVKLTKDSPFQETMGLKNILNDEVHDTQCINNQCVICIKDKAKCSGKNRVHSVYPCCGTLTDTTKNYGCNPFGNSFWKLRRGGLSRLNLSGISVKNYLVL